MQDNQLVPNSAQSVFQKTISLRPSISYYLAKLLRHNLPRLKSVVASGAGIMADSFNDLNAVIESLYLDSEEISDAIRELERLVLIHQNLVSQGMLYAQDVQHYEEKIYWLLGFKYLP